MRVRIWLCCLIWLLGVISLSRGQDTLTVMSYNIYHAENQKTSESSIRDIAGVINKIEPDFVALQEVDSKTRRIAKLNGGHRFSLADRLANLTGMRAYFGKAIDFDGGEYGISILSRELFESHKILLPNPRKGEQRVVLYLEVRTTSGREIIFGNTHLDHKYPKNRLSQVGMINDLFVNKKRPVILSGDFNFTPSSEEYDLMGTNWVDAGTAFRKNPEPTYPSGDPVERIDYIFLSSQHSWNVLDFHRYEAGWSDHLPVVARILLK